MKSKSVQGYGIFMSCMSMFQQQDRLRRVGPMHQLPKKRGSIIMRRLAVALLATTVMGTPAAFAASNNYQQQPEGQQTQGQQTQGQQTQGQQTQQNDEKQSRMSQDRQNAQNQNQNQQSAQDQQRQQGNKQQQSAENNQPIAPQNLSRSEIRQVQQALQKDGFHSGRADGRWGPETQSAVKQFQQSKQMEPTGKLDQQTVADLGLHTSQFSQSQNQQ
jgi:hypothetical protein